MSFFIIAVLTYVGIHTSINAESPEKQTKISATLADIVQEHPQLSKFWKLINKTSFTEILAGNQSFTLFAPSDNALELYQNSELAILLNPEYELELLACLHYHLIKSKYPTVKIENYRRIKTTTGEFLNIELDNSKIIINGKATIVQKNIMAKNGIVHIIDNILLPTELAGGSSQEPMPAPLIEEPVPGPQSFSEVAP